MAGACPAPDPALGVAERLAGYVDCRAQALGEAGWRGLAQGALFSEALTGLLTIYVALWGYRLLLGERPGVREVVLAAVRVGLVVALATSWPAFDSVAYRLAVDGPGEIAAAVMEPAGLPASGVGETASRLQRSYDAIAEEAVRRLARAAPPAPVPGPLAPGAPAQPAVSIPAAASPPAAAAPPPTPGGPLALADGVLLVTVLGGLLSVRVAAGFLLATGPLFMAMALFDATRGLVEGWARALGAAALGAAGASVVAALALGFVEFELAAAEAARALDPDAGLDGPGLLAVVALFALAMAVTLGAGAVAAFGLRLPRPRTAPAVAAAALESAAAAPAAAAARAIPEPPSRAGAVAAAVSALGRRERAEAASGAEASTPDAGRRAPLGRPRSVDAGSSPPTPLGSTLRRSARRPSGGAARRDARA